MKVSILLLLCALFFAVVSVRSEEEDEEDTNAEAYEYEYVDEEEPAEPEEEEEMDNKNEAPPGGKPEIISHENSCTEDNLIQEGDYTQLQFVITVDESSAEGTRGEVLQDTYEYGAPAQVHFKKESIIPGLYEAVVGVACVGSKVWELDVTDISCVLCFHIIMSCLLTACAVIILPNDL
jgi:hypothetical protein